VSFAFSVDDIDLKTSSLEGPITTEDKKNFQSKLKDTMDQADIKIAKEVRSKLEPFSNIILSSLSTISILTSES